MARLILLAALPGELKPLVRGWQKIPHPRVDLWKRPDPGDPWIAACAGAGHAAVLRALDAADAEGEGDTEGLVSLGWAGALGPQCLPGNAYWVSEVLDEASGERFQALAPPGALKLVSANAVAGPDAKRRLAEIHGADLVDMEAAAVARVASKRGLPFRCLKGVSDGHLDALPDFNRFLSVEGRFELASFLGFVALRPRLWPTLVRLGRRSSLAAHRVSDLLISTDRPKFP